MVWLVWWIWGVSFRLAFHFIASSRIVFEDCMGLGVVPVRSYALLVFFPILKAPHKPRRKLSAAFQNPCRKKKKKHPCLLATPANPSETLRKVFDHPLKKQQKKTTKKNRKSWQKRPGKSLPKNNRGKTYTTCGTPDYFAPELIASKGHG